MKTATVVFPHQLFENNPAVSASGEVFLVEEFLFFRQINFHKQKLVFHRASMKFYADFLTKKGVKVNYVESTDELSDVRKPIPHLIEKGCTEIHFCEVADNYLEKRIKKHADRKRRLAENLGRAFLAVYGCASGFLFEQSATWNALQKFR